MMGKRTIMPTTSSHRIVLSSGTSFDNKNQLHLRNTKSSFSTAIGSIITIFTIVITTMWIQEGWRFSQQQNSRWNDASKGSVDAASRDPYFQGHDDDNFYNHHNNSMNPRRVTIFTTTAKHKMQQFLQGWRHRAITQSLLPRAWWWRFLQLL